MRPRCFGVAALCVALGVLSFEPTAQAASEEDTITDFGAIWRSALLPGWGQYYKGRSTEATLALLAMSPAVVFFGIAAGFHYDGESVRDRYRSATPDDLQGRPRDDCGDVPVANCTVTFLRREADKDFERRDLFLILGGVSAGAGWIYNVLSAWLIEPGASQPMAVAPMAFTEGGGGGGVSLTLDF